MFFKSKAMNIREVTEYITNSFRKTTPYQVSGTSLPRVVNLLETPKKAKSKTIEQIYNEYIKYGRESVVLVSLSIASSGVLVTPLKFVFGVEEYMLIRIKELIYLCLYFLVNS